MKYFHKGLGRIVEIVPGQQFDTHWNYYDTVDGVTIIRQALPSADLVLLEEEQQPVLPENWGVPQQVEEVSSPQPPAITLREVATIEVAAVEEKEPRPPVQPAINLNTANNVNVVAQKLPGIGKIAAKKLLDRRPEGGYENFLQMVFLNKDLNLDNDAWEKVKELVEF
jgi:DNA uptake protein ComE-like DNA-binding protein